jgi:dTDP-4-dehydrorhamnose reductase
MTRWLITGANGQLGTELRQLLADEDVIALGHADLDIADAPAVFRLIADLRPDVVLNAAAYTAVDDAEDEEDVAYRVNASGPAMLAAALSGHGGRLVHVSTDYIFGGDAQRPYQVDSPTEPRSAYGRTKLAGELGVRELLPDASYVVRTSWVYGAAGENFVKAMVRLERERETISVVADQRSSPTWSADLARGLVELARSAVPAGIYHCVNTGDASRFELAQAIFAELGADPARVTPTSTDAMPRPAERPAYSVLSDSSWRRARLTPLRPWRDALHAAFATVGTELGVGAK